MTNTLRRTLLPTAVALALAGVALLSAPSDAAEPAKKTPKTSFERPDGGTFTLDTTKLERPTLLVFAANFCPICKRETPRFVALAKEKAGKLDVVGVVMDKERDDAKRYVDTQKPPYPTIWDPEWRFAMRYDVKATPTLVLLATDGTVQISAPGLTDALLDKL